MVMSSGLLQIGEEGRRVDRSGDETVEGQQVSLALGVEHAKHRATARAAVVTPAGDGGRDSVMTVSDVVRECAQSLDQHRGVGVGDPPDLLLDTGDVRDGEQRGLRHWWR